MGACTKISKFFLFAFNIIFWAAGGAMLGLGIYFLVNDNADAIVQIAGVTFYYAGCYIMISVGTIMFVLGFLGCCGAIKENKCLLGLYILFLALILIVQLFVGIWGFVNRDSYTEATIVEIEQDIRRTLNQSVPLTYDENDAKTQSVISIEKSFKCCGLVAGCTDWTGGKTHGCACTGGENCGTVSGCSADDSDQNTIYTQDCYDAIHNAIIGNIGVVAGIAIGIAVLEIFGIIFACTICRDRQSEYKSY